MAIDVSSELDAVLDGFEETFGHFHDEPGDSSAEVTLRVADVDGKLVLEDDSGLNATCEDEDWVLLALLERVNQIVLTRLAAIGVVAVHAGALVHKGGALIIAGPSGRGKSTLTLGLASSGMQLLSDELALIDQDAKTVLPYRRSVHVRPGTPELIPQLGFLLGRHQRLLGAGIRWAIPQERLKMALPGCLGDAAPLREVLLLEARTPAAPALVPIGAGSAVMKLLHGTPMAAEDMMTPLRRLSQAVGSARCARLRPGGLTQTLELIQAWIAAREPES